MSLAAAFTPLALGPLQLPNRFIKAGTYEGMTVLAEGHQQATAALAAHHAGIAAGGAALTTLGYVAVASDGRTFDEEMAATVETQASLAAVAAAVHAVGGKVSLQLGHCGTMTRTPVRRHKKPGGPSKTLNLYGAAVGALFTREMTATDMREIADEFVAAAQVAAAAGFDAIEIHMGHGYLLSQFLSPLANRRTDEFGGNVANRIRFPVEVARRVVEAVGDRLAVLVKANLRDGKAGGTEVPDCIALAHALEAVGVHALVMTGGFSPHTPMFLFRGQSMAASMLQYEKSRWNRFLIKLGAKTPAFGDTPFEELYFRQEALQVRAAVKGMKLALLGGVRSPDNVATAMADGFDAVVLGRPLLAEPDLVQQWQAGATAGSRCINCNRCVGEFSSGAGVRCVLNGPNDRALNLRAAG